MVKGSRPWWCYVETFEDTSVTRATLHWNPKTGNLARPEFRVQLRLKMKVWVTVIDSNNNIDNCVPINIIARVNFWTYRNGLLLHGNVFTIGASLSTFTTSAFVRDRYWVVGTKVGRSFLKYSRVSTLFEPVIYAPTSPSLPPPTHTAPPTSTWKIAATRNLMFLHSSLQPIYIPM